LRGVCVPVRESMLLAGPWRVLSNYGAYLCAYGRTAIADIPVP
jgi:hypothetical protein